MNGIRSRFIIQYHKTKHPHYHLELERDGNVTSWLIPKNIPEKVSERRLAIEDGEKKPFPSPHINIVDDVYGSGEAELWDCGKVEVKRRNNFRIEFAADGNRFSGAFVLLLPSWGTLYKKRLWTLIKL